MAITFVEDSNGDLVKQGSMTDPVATQYVHRPVKPASSLWPNNNYMIIDQRTQMALGAFGDKLVLIGGEWGAAPVCAVWHCLYNRGYFSFRNMMNRLFLCHDGNGRMKFADPMAKGQFPCELIMPRPHPEGGVQLMVPEDCTNFKHVVVDRDTNQIIVLRHRTPALTEGIWNFMKVDDYMLRLRPQF